MFVRNPNRQEINQVYFKYPKLNISQLRIYQEIQVEKKSIKNMSENRNRNEIYQEKKQNYQNRKEITQ